MNEGGNDMKKILTGLLVVSLLASMLAGCGKSSTPAPAEKAPAAEASAEEAPAGETAAAEGEQITLTFWTHVEQSWNDAQDKIIAEFEAANPNIKIQREGFPYDEFEAKTQTSLLSKSGGADIYELWGGWAIDYAPTGAFSPVPDDYVSHLIEDSYEPVLGAFEHDGKYYGVPWEFNIEYGGMLASVPKFKENNLEYPKTWDEMMEAAKTVAKHEGAIFETRGIDFYSWDTLTYTWLSMILSSGGQYMDGDKFDFATPIGIETMQKLIDYVKVDQVTNIDGLTNGGETEPYQWFFLGEALQMPRGPWVIAEGINDYELTYGEDFEYVAMPFYGSEKKFAAETGWGMAVNGSSPEQEAAWKFIEFWNEPERMMDFNIACGMIPASKTSAQNPAFIEALPHMQPLVDILEGGQYIGYFNTDTLKEAVIDMVVDIVNNDRAVEDAVKELDDTLNNG